MPSFANTLRRCHSTVRGLMNSWVPISGLVCPSPASRAICASCAVSSSRVSTRALAHRLAGGQQLAAGAFGEASLPSRSASRGRRAAARARRRGGSRGAAIRRRAGARGPAPHASGCGRAARSPRGTAARRRSPSLSSARERASMPSAQSVPLALVDLREPPQRRRPRARAARCVRPPRPARPAPRSPVRARRVSLPCSAAASASS